MTTREILKRLVKRFGLLVLLTVLGGAAGAAYAAVKTPTYQAKAYVVVTAEAGEGPAAISFAQAYGRVATTGPAAEKAAATLGSTRELAQVTASTSPDAPVIEIIATHTDAARSAAVANAVAQGLVDFAATRKAETRVSVSMLATATVPGDPSAPKPPLELAVGAAAGLLLAGLAALAGVGRAAVVRRRDEDLPNPDAVVAAGGTGIPGRPGGGAVTAQPVAYQNAGPAQPPALVNPGPTLHTFAGVPGDGGQPAATVPVQAVAWYDQAFAPDEMAAVLEGQIESPAADPKPGQPRIMGRAVVIYRQES